jgi:hypothetical protein
VRGDQVFGERFGTTTVDITSTEDFFFDISSLYINDMTNDTDVNVNLNVITAHRMRSSHTYFSFGYSS